MLLSQQSEEGGSVCGVDRHRINSIAERQGKAGSVPLHRRIQVGAFHQTETAAAVGPRNLELAGRRVGSELEQGNPPVGDHMRKFRSGDEREKRPC